MHNFSISRVGANVRLCRRRLKMNQRDLAQAAGVRQSTVAEWETGNVKCPRLATFVALCEALEADPKELLR